MGSPLSRETALDWDFAIEKHREALKRILATLVAMAGLACVGGDAAVAGATLPRRIHGTLLALLRPAEAAARRLVIIAARGLVVVRRKVRPEAVTPRGASVPATPPTTVPRTLSLPLFDPLPRWQHRVSHPGVPRISVPGLTTPFPIAERREPSPDDPIGAARLFLRLHALAETLNNLPRHARRFARWRAARAGAQERRGGGPTRLRRIWPLRPGWPPGHLSRRSRRSAHAVHEVLGDLHGLAVWTLNDTS
jgi:hypothetical protein